MEPNFGAIIALRVPTIMVIYKTNLVPSDCISGMRHCGLSASSRTGEKVKAGSAMDRSIKYSRHTRERMRFSFGTMMPPNARAKRKKDGRSQYSYSTSVLATLSIGYADLTDGLCHHGNPS
jgi:hypothetical protein